MIIKPYAGLPRMYAPDIGEVILARRTPGDKFVKAVVVRAARNKAGNLRLKVHWLADDPAAGAPRLSSPIRKPIIKDTQDHIVIVPDRPPLWKPLSEGQPDAGQSAST